MRVAASPPHARRGCVGRPPPRSLMDSIFFCYRADVPNRGGIVNSLQLRTTWLGLSVLAMALWLASCSKSDAATITQDESSVHGHHRHFQHHGHDHEDDDDFDNGHGEHFHCHSFRHCVDVTTYDDLSDGATYDDRWFDVSDFLGIGEPEAHSSRSVSNGALHMEATPFTTSQDYVLDHMKYFA